MLFEALVTRKTVTVGEKLILPYKLAEVSTWCLLLKGNSWNGFQYFEMHTQNFFQFLFIYVRIMWEKLMGVLI